MIFVRRRGVELARHVLPGEHRDHSRHGHRLVALDRLDPRMRMRRAQHLQMQRAFGRHVERVMRLAGDDGFGKRVAQAPAAGFDAGDIVFDIDHAMQRIVDAVIAGAAAKIALQHMRQILARGLVERRRGHDHACGAEAALKGLRIEKGLLHLVQLAVGREPFDGGDGVPCTAIGGHEAGMVGHAVEPHRAGAAVALVAPLLDSEKAKPAQECPEALPRRRLRREGLAVHREIHPAAPCFSNSARICSA